MSQKWSRAEIRRNDGFLLRFYEFAFRSVHSDL